MTVDLAAKIPCSELKALGSIPNIQLLGGVELKAFVDLAGGPPTDCKLTMSLLVQLAPLLASMSCLLKILDVMGKLKDLADAATDPTTLVAKVPKAAIELGKAIAKLSECIPPASFVLIPIMVKNMLQLVLRFLGCFLSQMDSLLEFRASLDLGSAEGNPVLRESLTCATASADAAQANLLKSLEPLMPVMNIVGTVAGLVGLPLTIPNFAAMSAGGDVSASVHSVKQAIDSLQKVVDGIPG